ncbi:MAG: hypothetical protein AAF532_14695 [Planctomycetota bacterium]
MPTPVTLFYPNYHALDPTDLLTFIHEPEFDHDWVELGLNDDDLHALQVAIMCDPTLAPVIANTNYVREAVFDVSHGPDAGVFVRYVHFEEHSNVLLLIAYDATSGPVPITAEEGRQMNTHIFRQNILLANNSR